MRLIPKLARLFTAALVVTISAAAPLAARTSAPAAAAVQAPAIQIDNFGRIDAHLYRGAQPKGHDYADLAALGVRTLIDLTSDDVDVNEKSMAARAGMRYLQIPMTTHEPPTAAQIATFLKVVTDPASQPVYVHCVGGRHRTGVMTALYRMTQGGWSADQAFKEMKRYKFGADFLHPEFKQFVYSYRMPATPKATPAVVATKIGN